MVDPHHYYSITNWTVSWFILGVVSVYFGYLFIYTRILKMLRDWVKVNPWSLNTLMMAMMELFVAIPISTLEDSTLRLVSNLILWEWVNETQLIYSSHSENCGLFKMFLSLSKIHFRIIFHRCKHCISWNWFIVKVILISKKCFEAIQNGGK